MIDPQLAMIYIPLLDYEIFAQHAKAIFGDNIDCSNTQRPCVFSKSCSDKALTDTEIPFKITIKDEENSKDIFIKKENMLIDGRVIGLDNQCFLGVFSYPITYPQQNYYYFGSPFLLQHYVSFSMEPWINGEGDYLKVGLGPICETANLGEMQYDPKYSDYDPQSGDISLKTSDAEITSDPTLVNTCVKAPLRSETAAKDSSTLVAILATCGGVFIITIVVIAVYLYRKKLMRGDQTGENTDTSGTDNLKAPNVGNNYAINTRGESVGASIDFDNEESFFGRNGK